MRSRADGSSFLPVLRITAVTPFRAKARGPQRNPERPRVDRAIGVEFCQCWPATPDRCAAWAIGSATAPTMIVRAPMIQDDQEIALNSVYPITHGETNMSTPRTIWIPSP